MKITLYTMILLGLFSTSIHAQCPPTPLVLSTQTEVTSFVTTFPNCTLLQGDLTITGSDISDLSGMPIDTLVGDLSISQLELASFSGMDLLERVEGSLLITSNFDLQDFSGLDQVSYIGGDLVLNTNFNTSYHGFEGLDTIQGSLRINGSSFAPDLTGFDNLGYLGSGLKITRSQFQTLSGLESLGEIYGNLELFDSRIEISLSGLDNVSKVGGHLKLQLLRGNSLDDLFGLDNLQEVGGDLSLTQSSFIHLNGLERLKNITGGLYIGFDYRLLDFVGLDSLKTIGTDFIFSYNNAQTSTIGLLQLETIGGDLQMGGPFFDAEGMEMLTDLSGFDHQILIGGTLRISDCPMLTTCNEEAICMHLQNTMPSTINNNALGCNTTQDVLASCGPLSVYTLEEGSLSVFPNPSEGLINILQENNYFESVSIYTSYGKKVGNFEIRKDTSQISVQCGEKGIIFLVFTSPSSRYIQKLMLM